MNEFSIIIFIIIAVVPQLLLLVGLIHLNLRLNSQGSELNTYVDLCKKQLDVTKGLVEEYKSLSSILEKEFSKERPKEQPELVELLDHIDSRNDCEVSRSLLKRVSDDFWRGNL